MNLNHKLVLVCLKSKYAFGASHIPTKQNSIADSLSRSQLGRFSTTSRRTSFASTGTGRNQNAPLFFSIINSQSIFSCLNKFHEFLSKYNFIQKTWPVPVTQLLHFIGYLSILTKSYITVTLYIIALSCFQKI